ncbi:MAG: BatA and WFA domain-containing protein [Planctomycetes bacterium]|nr:BatA and WFA domain-containing protein [Planctomycetota bacterium]
MAGLILAACVIPPLILLYFLKLRRRPHAIASTLLWKKSIEDLRANAPFQRLRRSLLLFLQLLALILLALALMQPQIQGNQNKGRRTILLIDNSASMTAIDGEEGRSDVTRLEDAKRRARERIETIYGGGLFGSNASETMIIAFSDRAEIYSRFTDSKPQLLAAIDRIRPTHGETNMEEALKLARAYTTNVNPDQQNRPIAAPAALELFSDGRIIGLAEEVLRGESLVYHRIGSLDADNVAINAVSVDRPYDRPSAVAVFASLLNMNPMPVTCDLQLSVDGVARGIESLDLPAAETHPGTGELIPGRNTVVFTPFEQPRGAVIEVANLRVDDLAADNVAQLIVPPPKRLKVALVSQRRSLIRTVLEGMALESIELLRPVRFDRFAEEGSLEQYDVVVLDNYRTETLPPGRYLIFGETPPLEGLNPYGEGKDQIVLNSKDEHPILRFVTLDYLYISKLKLIQPSDEVKVLAEGANGVPLIIEYSRGPLQVLYVTFDPLDSNWPFKRSFVTFIVNAIDYLGHYGEGLVSRGFIPGEAITTRLPPAAQDITLELPNRQRVPLSPTDPTMFSWGPIRESGLHVVSWKLPGSQETYQRQFAVNLFSGTEGNIATREEITIGQEKREGLSSHEGSYTPLWPWAVGLCLSVMMIEWWIYHRKMMI